MLGCSWEYWDLWEAILWWRSFHTYISLKSSETKDYNPLWSVKQKLCTFMNLISNSFGISEIFSYCQWNSKWWYYDYWRKKKKKSIIYSSTVEVVPCTIGIFCFFSVTMTFTPGQRQDQCLSTDWPKCGTIPIPMAIIGTSLKQSEVKALGNPR